MFGDFNIPYATMPITKRKGITIGGTRYFISRPIIEQNRVGGTGSGDFFKVPGTEGGPESGCARSRQDGENYCSKRNAGEQ